MKHSQSIEWWDSIVPPKHSKIESCLMETWPAAPGFVIAEYDLTKLLGFSQIKEMVHLQQMNGEKQSLLLRLSLCTKSTIDCMMQVYSNQLAVVEDDTFAKAARLGHGYLIKKLIDTDPGFMTRCGDRALRAAIGESRYLGRPVMETTAQLLPAIGANVFAIQRSNGCGLGASVMHLAARRQKRQPICKLLIDHANKLERSGLQGSVQRLLRSLDDKGRTPVDVARAKAIRYLETELAAAVSREGRVIYGMDSEDILIAKSSYDEACSTTSKSPETEHPLVEERAEKLRHLIEARRQEIDLEYNARAREIVRGSNATSASDGPWVSVQDDPSI